MIRGLYSAASGLQTASEQHEVTAYNLANASVPGYRQRGVVTESFDRVLGRTAAPTGDIVGSMVSGAYHDFRPGPFQLTGNPYDLALVEPDQFFTLTGPNGPLYTRNGTFRLNPQGRLVSESGYVLRGEEGPIQVPPETIRVQVSPDGTVIADGVEAGRIRPVRFADMRQLTAVGPTLYSAGAGARPTPAEGRVMQGYREGSNVQPADAMVRLLVGARYYEAAQRSLRTIAESLQLNTRPQA
jgi:flagellar basal body rod protein FlgG